MSGRSLLVALSLLVGVTLLSASLTWPYTMDDAYISLRYADHLQRGLGLSWNPGEAPVEGYSNFLWVIWMALACRVTEYPMLWTKLLGGGLGLCVVLLLAVEGRDLLGRNWIGLLPAAFLALSPMYAFWSVSGIEMPGFALALLAGLRGLRRRQPFLAGPALAAAVLLRPEGAVLAGAAGAVFMVSALVSRRTGELRALLVTAGIVLAAGLPYQVFRAVTFGELFANTVHAKWNPMGGVRYFLGELVLYDGVHLLLAAAAGAATVLGAAMAEPASPGRREGGDRSVWFACAILFLVQALVLSSTRPAMGFYLRLFWPVMPFLFLLSARGVGLLATRAGPAGGAGWMLAVPVAVLAAFPLVRDLAPVRLPGAPAAAPVRQTALAVREILRTVHEPLARWLREEHPGATVALTDCGVLPYESGARIIDLWGLNDRRIAREGFDAGSVISREPDLLILASRDGERFLPRFEMDGALFAHPETHRLYRLSRTFVWVNRLDGSGDYALWVYERIDHPDGRSGR